VSWIPVKEAAKLLRVSRQRVYQLVEQGKLMAVKREKTVFVNARSVSGRIALLQKEAGYRYGGR
jgi:excisionase family DNA binding protein